MIYKNLDKIINKHIPIAVKKLHQVGGYLALSAVVGECVG